MNKLFCFFIRHKYFILGGGFIFFLIPVLFILNMYRISRGTGLEGPRGGPQDAFRHTYASAITARYLSPKIVKLVTYVAENDPNSKYDKMDIHNNNLGIQIGQSKNPIYETIFDKIKTAEKNPSDANTIFILEQNLWQSSDIF